MHRFFVALVAVAVALGLLPASGAAGQPRPRDRRPDPALAPAGNDGLSRALARGHLGEAEYALARAAALFRPAPARARSPQISGTEPRLATLYLRDLAARIGDLSGAERERARRLLARPTAPQQGEIGYTAPPGDFRRDCADDFCVHWVVSTADAPDPAGSEEDGIPDWIDSVRAELTTIWAAVTTMGYRKPKSDATSVDDGGDERTDIYIMNLGPQQIYGYCTTDDPNVLDPKLGYRYFDASAYCVLDNDYAEYVRPGLPSLQVTAAHELFHAVQFAYDAFEDVWLMEGTATWIEDEIYDDINDNYQFLRSSHLTNPRVPLDFGDTLHDIKALFPYGTFLFWRFLTEYDVIGGSPALIREVWERADGSPENPPAGSDDYSLLALKKVIAGRQWAFRYAFHDFGIVNLIPHLFYEEGDAYLAELEGAPPRHVMKARVTRARPRKSGRAVLDHMTTGYAAFRPGRGVKHRARIEMLLDGPRRARGTEGALVVFRANGRHDVRYFRLNRKGDGGVAAPFGSRRVRRVVLVMTNASTRFDLGTCWQGRRGYFSCGGAKPLHENQSFAFTARLRQ